MRVHQWTWKTTGKLTKEKDWCTVEKCFQHMQLKISAWINCHEIIRFQASYIRCWSNSTFYNCELPLVWIAMHLKTKGREYRVNYLLLLCWLQTAHTFKNKQFQWLNLCNLLTNDFAESQVKNLVKKGGSLPSVTVKIGVSRARFSIRKSSTTNFWWKCEVMREENEIWIPKQLRRNINRYLPNIQSL